MEIKPEDLAGQGFRQLEKLDHQALVPFVQRYIKKWTAYSVFYYLFNILLLVLLLYLMLDGLGSDNYSFAQRFTYVSYGLLLSLALIPLHEYIHVLAYRSRGARNTSYAMNLKKFYFMALADGFVANRAEFRIVALAPFVVISTLLSCLLLLTDVDWTLTVVTTLLAHASMCAGDFGLLSFFAYHKGKEMVTYDEVATQTSFFYLKD